jgi:hypothetical protein
VIAYGARKARRQNLMSSTRKEVTRCEANLGSWPSSEDAEVSAPAARCSDVGSAVQQGAAAVSRNGNGMEHEFVEGAVRIIED